MASTPPGKVLNPKTGRYVNIDGAIGKAILAARKDDKPAEKPKTNTPPGKVLNPKTGRYVNKDGAIGKAILAAMAAKKAKTPTPTKAKSPERPTLEELVRQQMAAMAARDIPLWKKLTAAIEEEKKRRASQAAKVPVPAFLEACRNPVTKELPKIPTPDGEVPILDLIKSPQQLFVLDNMCYDLRSLFELIQADIPNGNVWGINPYVKAEGFVLPFDKAVKEQVLKEAIKRKILPKGTRYIDHSPANADDKEMRGTMMVAVKTTPPHWLSKGWGSDGSAFPTRKYYAVTFDFPHRRLKQNPGRTAIFPYDKESEQFIEKRLRPAYDAGCIWSKKLSVTDRVEVINPNIHMVFEDNQPNRWYAGKTKALEEEILKYAPAFV